MDSRRFFERVKIMRHFQKEYFKTRSRTTLQQSKALEREIEALERGEFNYYVPPTYINKIKLYIQ